MEGISAHLTGKDISKQYFTKPHRKKARPHNIMLTAALV